MTVATAPVLTTGDAGTPSRRRPLGLVKYLGLTPFAAYVLIFLAIPTTLAVLTGFVTEDGQFTWDNVLGLFQPNVLAAFGERRHGHVAVETEGLAHRYLLVGDGRVSGCFRPLAHVGAYLEGSHSEAGL